MATNISEGSMISSAAKAVAYPAPKVIAYGCTSGSFVNGIRGEEQLRESMKQGGIGRAVTASGAIVQALRSLGATRPAIVTPYNEETTLRLVSFLEEAEFAVAAVGFMGLEARIEDVEYAATKAAIMNTVAGTTADSVVVSCTNLRTFGLIAGVEKELGIPVVSANQATVWASLLAADAEIPSLGQRLFP
jgi:maleate isomerase